LYQFKRLMSHTTKALAEAGLIALLVLGLIAGTALAGKGGGKPPSGGTSNLAMVMVDPSDSVANHGDTVTFRFSTSNAYPIVSVTCSQGGVVVYGDSHPMYQPNIWDDPGHFILSSLAWTGGAADCRADLKGSSRGKIVTLGSTTFHVGA
jgi:hypothetical protein